MSSEEVVEIALKLFLHPRIFLNRRTSFENSKSKFMEFSGRLMTEITKKPADVTCQASPKVISRGDKEMGKIVRTVANDTH
jgi:hypothetical protein